MVKNFPINPELYDSGTSLLTDIHKACHPGVNLDSVLTVNIVVKFIYAYFTFQANEAISFLEIKNLFQLLLDESLTFREEDLIKESTDTPMSIADRFHAEKYPVEMTLDIPTTCQLFLEIAMRVIDPSRSNGTFTGLDLGAGTGILTLAQYICAKRNGFTFIIPIGVELGPITAKYAHRVIKLLGAGIIVGRDVTQLDTYNLLKSLYPLTFVSSETIPKPGTRVDNRSLRVSDPWVEGLTTLYKSGLVGDSTEFFPRSVQYVEGGSNVIEKIGNRENQFWHAELKSRLDNPTVIPTYIKSIEIDGNLIPLEDIGNRFITQGLSERSSMIPKRWAGKRKGYYS